MVMKNGKIWIGILVVAVVAAAAIGGGWYFRQRSARQHCPVCARPIHSKTRAVVEIDGKHSQTCCPACALALQAQTGRRVRLLSVADFDTDAPLAPERATYLVGSDVRTCGEHREPRLDEEKRPFDVHYDRCEPGILAFRTRERAADFGRGHGGKIATLKELGMR